MGLEYQSVAQGISVVIELFHVVAAETLPVRGGPHIRFHIAGAVAGNVADGALLGLPLQIAEGALVMGIECLVDGDGVDHFFHGNTPLGLFF